MHDAPIDWLVGLFDEAMISILLASKRCSGSTSGCTVQPWVGQHMDTLRGSTPFWDSRYEYIPFKIMG